VYLLAQELQAVFSVPKGWLVGDVRGLWNLATGSVCGTNPLIALCQSMHFAHGMTSALSERKVRVQ
jgi:hypothetical protein